MPHVANRNRFINPADDSDYVWEVNHDTEEQFGRQVAIDYAAPTADRTDFVRQEGQQEPLTFRLSGTILTQTQYNALWFFYTLSRAHTIMFEDFTGAMFEVIVTSFQPIRKRVARNPRGGTDAPYHIWTYSITMDVVTFVSGWPDPSP